MARRNTEVDFWDRVDMSGGDNACWEWQGRRAHFGHGMFDNNGSWSFAHRVAYTLWHGQPPRQYVCHHCDNPPCCNPAHLYDGSPADNARDREERNRRTPLRGQLAIRSKLSDAQAIDIYRRYTAGGVTMRALAAEYGVHHTTITWITTGKRRLADGSRPADHVGLADAEPTAGAD